jgi:hypothetical protein
MKTLHHEIEIDAPPEQVWSVLLDFDRYPEWNPFVTELRGTPGVGERLRVRLAPPGGRGITLKPRVTEVTPARAFEWLGRLLVPGLFDGRHRFELAPTTAGTRFTQHETFTGALVPLLARSLDEHTLAGFEAMNTALAARLEHLAAIPSGG